MFFELYSYEIVHSTEKFHFLFFECKISVSHNTLISRSAEWLKSQAKLAGEKLKNVLHGERELLF